jgi:LysR family hydrogen peroxide-inducible transcriptional activator
MELHQLRYFTLIAQTGSVSRAAAHAGVAQPSISQQLQKLERTLGHALFDRSRRRMILTDAGRALLPRAQRIISETDEIQRDVYQKIESSPGRLGVGAIPTIAPFLLPRAISAVKKSLPDCAIAVQEDLTENLLELLLDAEIDVALIASMPIHPAIDATVIGEEPMLAVVPAAWPLAKQKEIHLSDLRELPTISLHEMHCLGQQVSLFCEMKRLRPQIVCRTTQLTTILELVGLGLGISLVPEMVARKDASALRKYVPISGGPKRPIVAALRRGTTPRAVDLMLRKIGVPWKNGG